MLTYALAPTAEEAAAEVSAGKVQGDPDIATKQASFFLIKKKYLAPTAEEAAAIETETEVALVS